MQPTLSSRDFALELFKKHLLTQEQLDDVFSPSSDDEARSDLINTMKSICSDKPELEERFVDEIYEHRVAWMGGWLENAPKRIVRALINDSCAAAREVRDGARMADQYGIGDDVSVPELDAMHPATAMAIELGQ